MEQNGDNGRVVAPKSDGVDGHEERSRSESTVHHDSEDTENVAMEEGDDGDDEGCAGGEGIEATEKPQTRASERSFLFGATHGAAEEAKKENGVEFELGRRTRDAQHRQNNAVRSPYIGKAAESVMHDRPKSKHVSENLSCGE